MNIATEYGGRGADNVSYFKALTRIGREGTPVRTFFSGHLSIGAYPIQTWGAETWVKKKYLPLAAKGEKILAFGLTEPEAGSNPRELSTTFEKKGGNYALNGVKYLISNGGIADAIVIFAYPAGTLEDPKKRMSAFVLDTDQEGFEAESFAPEAKMGLPTSNTAMFQMNECVVPAENLLGTEGDGFLNRDGARWCSGRLSVAAGCLGVASKIASRKSSRTRRCGSSTARKSPAISLCRSTSR